MRSFYRFITATTAVAMSAAALSAQPGRGPLRPPPPDARERRLEMRERMLERREAMLERRGPGGRAGLGPRAGLRAGAAMGARMGARMGGRAGFRAGLREGRMMQRREAVRERFNALKPEQRQAMFKYRQDAQAERFRVGEEVRAGKLNREQASQRLQKWRDDHKPPVDLRAAPPKPPEGER